MFLISALPPRADFWRADAGLLVSLILRAGVVRHRLLAQRAGHADLTICRRLFPRRRRRHHHVCAGAPQELSERWLAAHGGIMDILIAGFIIAGLRDRRWGSRPSVGINMLFGGATRSAWARRAQGCV